MSINQLYDKERKSLNNAIINYLTNWSNQVDSIKDLNNRKADTEASILNELNAKNGNQFVEPEKVTISEYYSDEAEQNRQVKNESNTIRFVKETVGEEEKKTIKAEAQEDIDTSDLFEKEEV
jgi:hypothetical protein